MQSPPFPRFLFPPQSKYSPQHHVLKHPQLPFLQQCQRPSSFRLYRKKLVNEKLNFLRRSASILRTLWLICWVIPWVVLLWFDVCWCYVGVWQGWCGIRMQAEADTTPPQPNPNLTPTRIEPEQYNPWNNSTNKSQAPEDGCINIRNMLSSK